MPEMPGLTQTELAERAGATPERIEELLALGIVVGLADGTFLPSNVQRVRLAEALQRSGVPLKAVSEAIRRGALSFGFLDFLFDEAAVFTGMTYAQAAAERGWDVGFVQRVHQALGLPSPEPDDPVRVDDLRMFTTGEFALGLGMNDEQVARVLRVYGDNLRRIADAESPFFHTYVEEPLLHSGMSEGQMLETGSQMSPQIRELVQGLMLWLYRRHQEHSIVEHLVEHVESALESLGLTPPRPVDPPAMAFLDLVGYTRLTEERGDEAAAELALHLGDLVQTRSQRHGGRAVKWLGDGVMFHFSDAARAVVCCLEMVEDAPHQGLPPAHVGVHAGPVVFRDGDYFGRTVNVASRIAAHAGAGEVLVSEDATRAAAGAPVVFEPIGPVSLKNVTAPVLLHRAVRP
jgi:adenylate cyclase